MTGTSGIKSNKHIIYLSGKRRRKTAQGRIPWTDAENAAIKRQFCKVIRRGAGAPKKEACMKAKEMESALDKRSWSSIKWKVHNAIQTEKKKQLGNF